MPSGAASAKEASSHDPPARHRRRPDPAGLPSPSTMPPNARPPPGLTSPARRFRPAHSWCPAISRYWRCRRTARSSIRSSGFGTICVSHWLANSGVFQPGGHHRGLRDGLETGCQQPRPGPLTLRGRLDFASARSVGLPVIEPWSAIGSTLRSGNFRRSV
jgi:hypothetical protein